MTTHSSYRQEWLETPFYRDILTERGLAALISPKWPELNPKNEEFWDDDAIGNQGLSKTALRKVEDALDLMLFHFGHPWCEEFLSRGEYVATRTLREGPFWGPGISLRKESPEYQKAVFDWADANFKLVHALAASIRCNEPISPDALLESGAALIQYYKLMPRGHHGMHDQSAFLTAVMYALIANDVTRAQEILKIRKQYKRTQHWHGWVKALVEALVAQEKPVRLKHDHPVQKQFRSFFDLWRHPGGAPIKWKDAPNDVDEILPVPSRFYFLLWMCMVRDRWLEPERDWDWQRLMGYILE